MNFPKKLFEELYGTDEKIIADQTSRYENLTKEWETFFKKDSTQESVRYFTSAGRSEIGGNHTDHNLGKVLAASIQLDCIGVVSPSGNDILTIYDQKHGLIELNVNETERKAGETGSVALIRGMLQGFKNNGYKVGGFNAAITSSVIPAAGVSSSAAFEMLICIMVDALFNNSSIPVTKYAIIGQYAENAYWDKASGLLDQMACAVGGLVAMDFENPKEPKVEKVPFDFAKEDYSLMIVNTGKGHADLSAEYSSIPNEMKAIARVLGQETLRGLKIIDIADNLAMLRKSCGDRAVMRAFHFIIENDRVDNEVNALKDGNFQKFLSVITESGNSSWKWLQNVFVTAHPEEQSISICLALTEMFIREKAVGACRIHGGGFAGVIQAFLPNSVVAEYTNYMEHALGYDKNTDEKSPVYAMFIRPYGAIEIK